MKRLRPLWLVFVLLVLARLLPAQGIIGLSTRYSDSFVDWVIYTEDESLDGSLVLRWANLNDWTSWDFRIGEFFGSVDMKFKDNPNMFELRAENQLVTMQTIWQGDFFHWRITAPDGKVLTLECMQPSNPQEWELRSDDYGLFRVYTAWENDFREWAIDDNLVDGIGPVTRFALAFVAIMNSTPKR